MKDSKISVLIADDNKEFCNILNDYLLNQRDDFLCDCMEEMFKAVNKIDINKALSKILF